MLVKFLLTLLLQKDDQKMYDIMQEKYKTSVFQICKAFSNFDFNSTIRKKYTGFCNCSEIMS